MSGYTLGEDMLTFIDTMGEAPTATTTPEASAVDVLMKALDSVSLNFNGTNYTGITFGIDGTGSLQITFAGDGLNEDGLITALGSTITNPTELATIFEDGSMPPSGTADEAALSTAGIALIDTLFGDGTISVADTLPAELL